MQLNNPVILNVYGDTVTMSELNIILMDDVSRKLALARVAPFCRPIPLWTKEAYDAIGDYTQAQAEQRVLEILGENIQEKLQSLVI